jgi:hypothetical protein
MSLSRRVFLKRSAFFTVAATLPISLFGSANAQSVRGLKTPAGPYYPVPNQSMIEPLARFKLSAFSPYLNTTFRATDGTGQTIRFTLIEAKSLGQRIRKSSKFQTALQPTRIDPEDCFSLLFRPTRTLTHAGGTFEIEHDALGKFTLMLSPVGKSRINYEAIINRTPPVS